MQIVLDSNTLFSALIKDALTRRLILDYESVFLFPSFIFEEMDKHKGEIFRKSKLNKEDFEQLLNLLLNKVEIVSTETLLHYRKKAEEIIKEIDINDVLFIACVLAHPGSVLWSDDKALKKQNKVKVLNTSEIKEHLLKPGKS